jgi:hypothetical protein
LKKAFDTVNHEILIQKLERYGIRGLALQWFRNYLSDRKQFIQHGDMKSTLRHVTCGVPQGSNLGPVLFLLYVNGLPQVLENTTSTLFADDTTLKATGENSNILQTKMNADLELTAIWFEANKLTLNINKTAGCHFRPQSAGVLSGIMIENQSINIVKSVRYLGLYVDEKLCWSDHIKVLTNKVNKYVGMLARVRNHLDSKSLKILYTSLVHSSLMYGIELWGNACNSALEPLFRAQKKLLRTISFKPRRQTTAPLFFKWKIRPLPLEIKFRLALLSRDVILNEQKYGIQIEQDHHHQYPTRFVKKNLPIPTTRTKRYGTQGIIYVIVKIYNELPTEIKNIPNTCPNMFKSHLDKYLWQKYIEDNELNSSDS